MDASLQPYVQALSDSLEVDRDRRSAGSCLPFSLRGRHFRNSPCGPRAPTSRSCGGPRICCPRLVCAPHPARKSPQRPRACKRASPRLVSSSPCCTFRTAPQWQSICACARRRSSRSSSRSTGRFDEYVAPLGPQFLAWNHRVLARKEERIAVRSASR